MVHQKKIFLFYLIVYSLYLIVLTLSPFRFRPPQLHHFPWPIGPSRFEAFDVVSNLFLFLPFGFLMAPLLNKNPLHRTRRAMLISAGASLTIEVLQIFIVGRFPAVGDIVTNTMGGGIGCLIGARFEEKRDLFFAGQHQLHTTIRNLFLAILTLYCGFLLYLPSFSGKNFPPWNANIKILIGNNPEKTRPWKGELVSLAIYDKAVSFNQIKRNYQNGSSKGEETVGDFRPIFNGSSTFVDPEEGSKIYQQIHLTQQMTVEAWIKPQRQFDSGGRFFSFVEGNRSLFYLSQEVDEISIGVRSSIFKRWHFHSEGIDEAALSKITDHPVHLVGVYDPEKMALYFNGRPVSEGLLANKFFLLANHLNLDRMPFGGRGLLGLFLFWPLGIFLPLALKRFSTNPILYTLPGFLFVGLILLRQTQDHTLFFTERTAWVPFLGLILGVISGERAKRVLLSFLDNLNAKRNLA